MYDVAGKGLGLALIGWQCLLLSSLAPVLFAQGPFGTLPNTPPPRPPAPRAALIGVAEAVLEDGGKPPSRPDFTYTDSCYVSLGPSSGACLVKVSLKGFRETVEPVRSSARTIVVLQRLGAEGEAYPKGTINLAALGIPAAAQRAYAKGEAAMGLHDLPEAEKWFRLAVKEYPGHALAWDELGLVLERLRKVPEARSAYQCSVAADSRLARPLIHLAGMAIAEQRWQEAADLTAQALILKPAAFQRAWFYDALANFVLGRSDRAVESARRTIELDSEHGFPSAEYVLGVALTARGEYGPASEHLGAYLALAPKGRFAARARQRLAELNATSNR